MRKILLNNSKGKKSVNNTNIIPVELNRDVSIFNDEILTDTIDTMQVYNDEKDKSKKHRFIFTIHPICSNALFNHLTEIVYEEGSDKAKMLTESNTLTSSLSVSRQVIDRTQAIRNTEYTNDEFKLNYHCGADIFNNHLLRSKEDITVQKINTGVSNKCTISYDYKKGNTIIDSFNTIGDFSRTYLGYNVDAIIPNKTTDYTYSKSFTGSTPLYIYDTIKTFTDAYNSGIKRKDGWLGFNNTSTFYIPVKYDKDYYVNKCFNNKESCQFIDMSPERDLFSFTPKKNSKRNRIEYNWDYFITYPYKSNYNDGIILRGKGEGLPLTKINDNNYKEYNANNGIPLVMFCSPVNHGLSVGDSVNIKFSNKENIKCTVISIGDSNGKLLDRYFSIKKSDYEDYISENSLPERFAKIVYGFECEYYFRIFKKIDKYQRSDINRLAFAGTIYGDEVSQIVFTDDTNIDGYIDNRGRPLTELYLTIVKTNRGNDLWYNSNNYTDERIEYSRVFGKVSSGLNLPSFVGTDMPTIRKQHNINVTKANQNNDGVVFQETSKKIESNITNETDEFYGDLVEFNPNSLNETVLENVYHRFNTAQRETTNELYTTIFYDEIDGDIYDGNYYGTSNVSGNTRIKQFKLHEGYANLAPEGYIYKPHYKIKIGEFDSTVNQGYDSEMNVFNESIKSNEPNIITFETEINYSLLIDDTISIVTKDNFQMFQYSVISYVYNSENNKYKCEAVIKTEELPSKDLTKDNYYFFKHNLSIPTYSYMLPDGSGRHLWREIIKPSELTFMDDLYNIPFTNGAFYHHATIDFFVRRQDPFHNFGMQPTKDGKQIENNFNVPSVQLDTSSDEHVSQNSDFICF